MFKVLSTKTRDLWNLDNFIYRWRSVWTGISLDHSRDRGRIVDCHSRDRGRIVDSHSRVTGSF